MNASMEQKKAEAIKRMKMLKIFPPVIKQFEHDGTVNISEPPLGAHFWLDDENKKRVADFEKQYNALVFTGIRSFTSIGKMDSFFFVSDHKEEWPRDWEALTEQSALVWVYNHDMPDCSEIGSIGFGPTPAAGLCRIW